jgi:hypothetical protein
MPRDGLPSEVYGGRIDARKGAGLEILSAIVAAGQRGK